MLNIQTFNLSIKNFIQKKKNIFWTQVYWGTRGKNIVLRKYASRINLGRGGYRDIKNIQVLYKGFVEFVALSAVL